MWHAGQVHKGRQLCERTRCKLADCVEQLKLPALFYVVYGLRNLISGRLDVELQAKAVDVVLACTQYPLTSGPLLASSGTCVRRTQVCAPKPNAWCLGAVLQSTKLPYSSAAHARAD